MISTVINFIRTTIFSILYFIGTVSMGTVTTLLRPKIFPYKLRYGYLNFYSRSNVWMLKHICGLNYKFEGLENIPEKNAIIFCKHQSTWETFILQLIFHPVSFVAKKELMYVPFFGWGLAAMKPIIIKRGSGKKAITHIIKQGSKLLDEGVWIAVFPEGTRTDAYHPGRYHPGGALLAKKSGFPIVPVAHNAGELWPRQKYIKKPGEITVRVGPAIETTGKTADEILEESKQWIEAQMPEITRYGEYKSGEVIEKKFRRTRK